MKLFFNAILAGVAIGIAGTVSQSVSNPIVGAALFGFGLLSIVMLGFSLYTGVVGYLVTERSWSYALKVAIVWCGNLVGTGATALLLRATRVYGRLGKRIGEMTAVKSGDSLLSLFVLAIFCGLLMYIAVDTFKNRPDLHPVLRMILLFLCVIVFILSGFEHSIADMYYFAMSSSYDIVAILVVTAGNAVGSFVLPLWKAA